MTESIVHYGSDIKLSLYLDFKDIPIDQVDFDVVFNIGKATLTMKKSQLVKVGEKNYLVCIKYPDTQTGVLKATLRAKLPDADFSDRIRNVVRPISSNIKIV